MKKRKTWWLYLDGKKHCDVLEWAMAANMMLNEAKVALADMYKHLDSVEFKLI